MELKARPEKIVRALAREQLEADGWKVWIPAKVKYAETDIHGIWDALAWKAHKMRFIQYTTAENINARAQKVAHYMMDNLLTLPAGTTGEIWGLRADGTWRTLIV